MKRSSHEETLLDNLFWSLVVMIFHPIVTLNPINSIASPKFLALADIANFLQFAIEVTAILLFSVGANAFMNRCMHGLVWNYLSLASLYLRMICLFWSTLVFQYVCELWLTNLVHSPSRTDDP